MDRSGRRYTQFKNFKKYNSAVNENEKLSAAFDIDPYSASAASSSN